MANSVDHTSRAHALLSASGADRWMNCTPSARLEQRFEESKDSIYAMEGTLAHEFGDLNLRYFNKEISKKTLNVELKKLRKDKLYTYEMEEQVEKYTDYVIEEYNSKKDALLLVEQKLDFSHIVEKGFGTGDTTIIADEVLDVIDLKYGKGVQVDAKENPQLKLYGIGALRKYDLSYDIKIVRLTIVQPRLDHISTWDIKAEDLIEWGEKQVKPKAAKAFKGLGVQKAGSWCKWCRAKAMCATLAAENIKLARHEFRDPHLLTEEQVLGIHAQIPMLVDWAKGVDDYLLKEAVKGKKWPGLKLVEGRSTRKIADEKGLRTVLIANDFKEEDFTETKLLGITKLEKLVGKKKIKDIASDYIVKPMGAPTLTTESDPKPAFGLAEAVNDFSE